jgi:hypothetical protein
LGGRFSKVVSHVLEGSGYLEHGLQARPQTLGDKALGPPQSLRRVGGDPSGELACRVAGESRLAPSFASSSARKILSESVTRKSPILASWLILSVRSGTRNAKGVRHARAFERLASVLQR